MPAGGLEQVERADGVDVEIVERPLGGQVVARLGGGVDDQVEVAPLEERLDRRAVANVERLVREVACRWPRSRWRFQVVSPLGPKKSARMLLSTPVTRKPSVSKKTTASEPISPLLPVTKYVHAETPSYLGRNDTPRFIE